MRGASSGHSRAIVGRCHRASDLGIELGRLPSGDANAITDVEGVRVGHTTLIEGEDVRTGVTVVVPPARSLFAGAHRINGNGELTGFEWIRDSGRLTTSIALTNTHSVGVVRDALVAAAQQGDGSDRWSLPVVGETWDGFLNDINGFHVTAEHVESALASPGAPAPASADGHPLSRNVEPVMSLRGPTSRRRRGGSSDRSRRPAGRPRRARPGRRRRSGCS